MQHLGSLSSVLTPDISCPSINVRYSFWVEPNVQNLNWPTPRGRPFLAVNTF